MNLKKLEASIGYTFRDPSYLELALTHSSYANEHYAGKNRYNERLEFLGDAVLELCSSEFLYRHLPQETEGVLSKRRASMVCEPALAYCAREIQLSQYLKLGKGEEANGGRQRDSILSDALEAVLGAVYLDGGLEPARAIVFNHIMNDMEKKTLFYDSKTILQEMLQKDGVNGISYRLVSESGPDHDKHFVSEVLYQDQVIGRGEGHSKKAAEQQAAYEAILAIKEREA
ncbi:MAG: ribonuclease III [Lachnospiraceae bacterium]|nr:ribonuclease III [Lachnospiraceae bacterium]